MDISDYVKLNELWTPIYPYLAKHVSEFIPPGAREVLEIGPFSGGVSIALAELLPEIKITIAEETEELRQYFKEQIAKARLETRIRISSSPLAPLNFPDNQFDGVIFRGAFFFLDDAILKDVFRVLGHGGVGVIGGGFGRWTPAEAIEPIAAESRSLNYKLGKKWISREQAVSLISQANLEKHCNVIEEGGLWIIVRK